MEWFNLTRVARLLNYCFIPDFVHLFVTARGNFCIKYQTKIDNYIYTMSF